MLIASNTSTESVFSNAVHICYCRGDIPRSVTSIFSTVINPQNWCRLKLPIFIKIKSNQSLWKYFSKQICYFSRYIYRYNSSLSRNETDDFLLWNLWMGCSHKCSLIRLFYFVFLFQTFAKDIMHPKLFLRNSWHLEDYITLFKTLRD